MKSDEKQNVKVKPLRDLSGVAKLLRYARNGVYRRIRKVNEK